MRVVRVRMDADLIRLIDVWVQQLGDTFLTNEWNKLAPRLRGALQGGK